MSPPGTVLGFPEIQVLQRKRAVRHCAVDHRNDGPQRRKSLCTHPQRVVGHPRRAPLGRCVTAKSFKLNIPLVTHGHPQLHQETRRSRQEAAPSDATSITLRQYSSTCPLLTDEELTAYAGVRGKDSRKNRACPATHAWESN